MEKKYDLALQGIEQETVKSNSEFLEVLRVEIFHAQGQFEKAKQLHRQMLENSLNPLQTLSYRAIIRLDIFDNQAQGLEDLKRVVLANPQQLWLHYYFVALRDFEKKEQWLDFDRVMSMALVYYDDNPVLLEMLEKNQQHSRTPTAHAHP